MTDDQWRMACGLMSEMWDQHFPQEKRDAYAVFLQEVPFDLFMQAVKRLGLQGAKWFPKMPELLTEVEALSAPQLPGWSEVWHGLQLALRMREEERAAEWMLPRFGVVAVAFMRTEGFDRLRATEFFDPEYGMLRVKELEGHWTEFARQAEDRRVTGRATGALKPWDPFPVLTGAQQKQIEGKQS